MTDSSNTYLDAGVDLEAANESVEAYKKLVKSTHIPGVLGELGGFGGLFSLKDAGIKGDPVLVTATDGVGTKLKIAHQMGKHDTIGQDLVAMCVNDVITTGARPLLFLDYLATGKLNVQQASDIVSGIANACREVGCALIGGETAEMPGFYAPGEYDVAGFCVGVVDRSNIMDPSKIVPGDVCVGLPSSGFHSNGYSLIRRIVETESLSLDDPIGDDDVPLGLRLLEPTRLYVGDVLRAIDEFSVKGAAHITGGGVVENLPRVLPENVTTELSEWPVPEWMKTFCDIGRVPHDERRRVFNMGIGMILVMPEGDAETFVAENPEVVRLGVVT